MRNSVQCLPIGQLEMLGPNELERLDLLPHNAQPHAAVRHPALHCCD
jgi:hypothetical protein